MVQFKSERSYSLMLRHNAVLRLNDLKCQLDTSVNPFDRSFKSELLVHTLGTVYRTILHSCKHTHTHT